MGAVLPNPFKSNDGRPRYRDLRSRIPLYGLRKRSRIFKNGKGRRSFCCEATRAKRLDLNPTTDDQGIVICVPAFHCTDFGSVPAYSKTARAGAASVVKPPVPSVWS